MSESYQPNQLGQSLPPLTTITTTTPKVSHEPQHWHHHHMTDVISSTPPPSLPSRSTHDHHSTHHHAPHTNQRAKLTYAIRPGTTADLPAIHKIYTYYALNTSITLLVNAPDIKYIEKAYHASISRHMPYLVAVTGGMKDSNAGVVPSKHLEPDHVEQQLHLRTSDDDDNRPSGATESDNLELVLGYGHIVPLHADKAGYGPAVELTIYVHPSYLGFGIGSTLLSALEIQLRSQPVLVFEEGHEDKGRETMAEVLVSRVSCDLEGNFEGVRMDRDGDEEGGVWPVWKTQGEKNREWYLRKGFEEVGRMKGVGEKFGKRTDVTILQKNLVGS